MCTIKRLIVLICTTALCVCLFANAKAKADAYPTAPEILDIILAEADITSIANAYTTLTYDQKLICNYIIGAFSNAYLCARGFSYSIPDDETSYKAQFLAMGETVWQYATTAYGWKSRFNEVFRQYLSSTVIYASGISTTFDAWYDGVRYGGNQQLYIPYSEEAFSAWTSFYNDPSGDGISSFGYSTSPWTSGSFWDFAFLNYPWYNTATETSYNDFILYNSPVIYSSDVTGEQLVISGEDNILPDALFVLRATDNNYASYRFGYSATLSPVTQENISFIYCYLSSNKIRVGTAYNIKLSIVSATVTSRSFLDLVQYAFTCSPFRVSNQFPNTSNHAFKNAYPLCTHVYLVDDLNTFSNIEEVFYSSDLNIDQPVNSNYIIAPNGRMILPIWPYADDDPMGFWDIIQENSYNVETELPATDDDYHNSIVNNTTINNYYVSDSSKINVPVTWFENDYTEQLAIDSLPFLTFAHDCIDSLGDLQLYLYGAIVIGLGGGIVKKLLL